MGRALPCRGSDLVLTGGGGVDDRSDAVRIELERPRRLVDAAARAHADVAVDLDADARADFVRCESVGLAGARDRRFPRRRRVLAGHEPLAAHAWRAAM